MPSRSISPSTVEETSVRVTPRAAAMLARPAVRQAARACSTYSTGVGPLSRPTRTAGWSASKTNVRSCARSSPTPKNPSIVPRLWVPLTHSFRVRNWNFAASGACFTASRVANRAGVSTPLRADLLVVVVMACCPPSCAGEHVLARGWSGGERRRLLLDHRADAFVEFDERRQRRIGRHRAGEVEHLPQR